jgi:hypothetical protein
VNDKRPRQEQILTGPYVPLMGPQALMVMHESAKLGNRDRAPGGPLVAFICYHGPVQEARQKWGIRRRIVGQAHQADAV